MENSTKLKLRKFNFNSKNDIIIFLQFILEIVKDYERSDTLKNAINYIEKDWLGYGIFRAHILIGICVIKNPLTKPETTTIVLPSERNAGVAQAVRDFAIKDAVFNDRLGEDREKIVSEVNKNNIASLKSILNSGFKIIEMEDDTIKLEFDLQEFIGY